MNSAHRAIYAVKLLPRYMIYAKIGPEKKRPQIPKPYIAV
jgi:hypothetical protein